ncbi:MAG: hypothetical protein P8170_17420 [Gemmatimonadota bacterium]
MKVDEARALSAQGQNLRIGPDPDDDIAPHGDRLGPGTGLVPRPHATGVKDEIGRELLPGAQGSRQNGSEKGEARESP